MNAYIVGAVRTAAGRRKGALSHWHPAELGARAIDGLMAQVGIAPEMMHRIDDVIFSTFHEVRTWREEYQPKGKPLIPLRMVRVCARVSFHNVAL